MKAVLLALAATGALVAASGFAQSGPDVLKAKGCLTCHDASQKKVGPSFKDIASKHKDDKGAEGKLVEKVKEGKGHPKVAASDSELKAAVQHMLSAK